MLYSTCRVYFVVSDPVFRSVWPVKLFLPCSNQIAEHDFRHVWDRRYKLKSYCVIDRVQQYRVVLNSCIRAWCIQNVSCNAQQRTQKYTRIIIQHDYTCRRAHFYSLIIAVFSGIVLDHFGLTCRAVVLHTVTYLGWTFAWYLDAFTRCRNRFVMVWLLKMAP